MDNNTHAGSLFTLMAEEAARLLSLGRIRSSEALRSTLHSFTRFRDQADLSLDALDDTLIQAYEGYLRQTGVVRNTISFYMRNLRGFYHTAVERGLVDDCQPFRHVYTGIDKTTKRALPRETLSRMRALDLAAKPGLGLARDLFMFSFYTRGMPFVDMAYLRKSDLSDGYLTYRRRKTGQLLTIEWLPEMQEIVDRHPSDTDYLLPIITREDGTERRQYTSQLARTNRNLHSIGTMIGLTTPLTSYCSRHGWASIAQSLQVPVTVISQGLGHENLRTTQIYLDSLHTSVIDAANRRVITSL